MRLNRFIAASTGLARRVADEAIAAGRVQVNGQPSQPGQQVSDADSVTLDGRRLQLAITQTILLNKPVGYVTSRDGQGSKTVYDLLPAELHHLKPVGRLDKDSSGLLLLTNDGALAQQLTHPKYQKTKQYAIALDKPLGAAHRRQITETGVKLEDGLSKFQLEPSDTDSRHWRVIMHEGRNRQIRRSFAALGYTVTGLHRTQFGAFRLHSLASGSWKNVESAG